MSGENTDPRTEQGIGRSLEGARKSRGLSLWQVEQETRIRSRYLRDLEREDFDVLPAVYVLGSLKTYADFLGLDGAALSRQLKTSLIEPDVPAEVATIGGARDEEDEYEAAPVPAVGFDQLFLGMGVILISILAIMTLATALAQGDRSPVSQVDQPSTPEPPSEIALAGNVQDEGDGTVAAGDEEDGQGEGPEAPKGEEQGEEEDQWEDPEEDQNASQATSIFGDAEFVPMSPPSTASATSAASASPAPSTAQPDDSSVPAAPASAAPASRERPRPANDSPRATSAPSDTSAPAPAPTPAPAGPRGGGRVSSPQGSAPGSGPISADIDRMIDEAFRENGLD